MTTITLYAVSGNSKIKAIQCLRAIATMQGAKLGLRNAKMLVDDIAARPIVIDIPDSHSAIVHLALRSYFETQPPEAERAYLHRFFEYDNDDPAHQCPDDTYGGPSY